jgi:hypothetical protein
MLSVYPPPPLTFECLNHSLWNLICISWHLVHIIGVRQKYLLSVCVPIVARQQQCNNVPAATNTRNKRKMVGYMCLDLCILLSLLGNSSVSKQRRIVGCVFFYAVHVVSYESRRISSSRNFLLKDLLIRACGNCLAVPALDLVYVSAWNHAPLNSRDKRRSSDECCFLLGYQSA